MEKELKVTFEKGECHISRIFQDENFDDYKRYALNTWLEMLVELERLNSEVVPRVVNLLKPSKETKTRKNETTKTRKSK